MDRMVQSYRDLVNGHEDARATAVEAARGARAIVVITSDKVYAPGAARHREDDPLGGEDPYSASKAAQELVAASYRAALGLSLATVRAGDVIGGGDFAVDRSEIVPAAEALSQISKHG